MGFFGGDDSSQDNGTNDLLNESIRANQAELESKRANLYQERLGIIKSQGVETWRADRNAGLSPTAPTGKGGGGGRASGRWQDNIPNFPGGAPSGKSAADKFIKRGA